MASRFTRHIIPRTMPFAQLLLELQLPISTEAADALEERDARWKTENADLRSQCRELDDRCRKLARMVEDFRATHAAAINNLKGDCEIYVERMKNDAVDRVLDFEAKLQESEDKLSKMIQTVDVLNEENVDLKHELDQVKSKKNDEIDRNLKEKRELETKLTEEALRIEDLEKEGKELQAEVSNLKKEKANEIRRIFNKINEKAKVRVGVLERKNGELEAQLCKTKSEMSAEIDRISEDKDRRIEALEREKLELEAQLSKEKMASENHNRDLNAKLKARANKISQLNDSIVILTKEKGEIDAELSKIKNGFVNTVEILKREKSVLETEKSNEIDRISKEKLGVEVQSRRIEKELKEMKETNSSLLAKNAALEDHIGKIEAEVKTTKIEKIDSNLKKGKAGDSLETIVFKQGQSIAQLRKNNKALRSQLETVKKDKDLQQEDLEEKEMKIMELISRTMVLHEEKGIIEAEILKAKKDNDESDRRISKVKKDLEDGKRQVEEAHNQISEYMKRIGVLETSKVADLENIEGMKRIIRDLVEANKKKIEEIKRVMEDEDKKKAERIELLEKEKKEMKEEKIALEDEKRSKEDENKKAQGKQLQRITELQKNKRSLENEYKKKVQRIEVLEKEKKEMEVSFCRENKEKSDEIKKISDEKMEFESEKRTLEDEYKKKVQRIEVLEKEKKEMEESFCRENKEKNEEIKKISDEKMAFESEKRTLEEDYKKKVQRIEVLEKEKKEMEESFCREDKEKSEEIKKISDEKMAFESEKRTMEDEYKKKVLDQVQRIEGLEKEKKEMEERLCRENKEKSEEIMKMLDEKRAMEVELVQTVSVLEKEKMEIEGKICELDKQKSKEMERILNEKIAMEAENRVAKEVDAKKILELTGRIGILEREQGEIEAEVMEKDEVIKDLDQDNTNLLETKRKLEMQITQMVSSCKKIMGRVTKASQDIGKKYAAVSYSTEHNRSISHNAGKRKRDTTEELSGGSSSDVVGMSKKVLKPASVPITTSLMPCQSSRKKPQWETDQNLLDEFDVDNELCLKAVCSLYRRRHTVLSGIRGGIALAEYLIDDDPKGLMTKTVADVQQFDMEVFDTAIRIAKQCYKQVFEIYKKSEDPLFLA